VVPTWALWVALVIAITGLVVWAGYFQWPTYSGFGGGIVETKTKTTTTGNTTVEVTREKQPARKVWDWLGLVGIGSALTLGGWIVTRQQRERDEAVASEQAQNTALAAYLDQMSNLMVDQKLGSEHQDPTEQREDSTKSRRVRRMLAQLRTIPVRLGLAGDQNKEQDDDSARKEHQDRLLRVAQARTIAVLLGLDGEHKRRPLKLVYELGLIKKNGKTNGSLLELRNVGLDHANLGELSLPEANLSCADLRVSDLSGADLSRSDLCLADLRGADLRRANLRGADLWRANLLPYDERDPERWSLHNLAKIKDLSNDNFRPRKLRLGDRRFRITVRDRRLTATELATTNLGEAILAGADLCGAYLSGADLRKADLSKADLRGADLRQARHLTQEQIDVAFGDETTKLTEERGLHRPEAWSKNVKEQLRIIEERIRRI